MAHVLIVEDDKFLSKIYLTKLEKEGLKVEMAHDGEQGLKMMKEKTPSLILLDLIMPKKDGFAVLEEMKKDSKLSKIPILVLSNLGQESDIKKAQKLGVKDFIIKSDTSIKEVVTKIRKYIK